MSRTARIAAAVAVVCTLLALGRWAGGEIPRFAEWVAGLGALGPAVFIAGYALAVVAFVPASLLTLAAGAIFGLGAGVLWVFCAATLGASLAFLVSRYVARGAVEKRIAAHEGFAAIDRAVAADGRRIVFLLRLSPAFPFTLLNYALGLTRVRFVDFVSASVGMLPGTFLYVYYGKLAGDVAALAGGAAPGKGAAHYAVLVLGLVATVAVTALVTRTARKALAEAAGPRETGAGVATTTMAATLPARDAHAPHGAGDGPRATGADHDRRLRDNVQPADWTNPEPARRYDLVVIGAGAGGLISAAVASGLGARVALVEKHRMGGDCLNTGCVPSKALIRRARRVAEARALLGEAALDEVALDRAFEEAMEHLRAVRAEISEDDSTRRYRDELGVDVFLGEARFTGPDAVEVDGRTLRFRKAVVATGARAALPGVPGLAESGCLTNETVFDLARRPRRMVVLGAGPIGCELAQAMRRFGVEVTIVDTAPRVLAREDADASAILARRLEAEGVRLALGAAVVRVERDAAGATVRVRRADGVEEGLSCDEVLVAVGRRANVEGIGLEAAGIDFTANGVVVDANLRTTNPKVFAVGDCCMEWKFTHAADAAAKIVVQNALFFGRKKLGDLVMPRCTYTDPEIAHVGLDEDGARRAGIETDAFAVPLSKVNRAVCDGEDDGFVRLHVRRGSDRVVGATIVASHAGDLAGEVALAITSGIGLAKVAATIHPYPTQAEGIKAAANAWMRTRLTPTARRALSFLLRVQGMGGRGPNERRQP